MTKSTLMFAVLAAASVAQAMVAHPLDARTGYPDAFYRYRTGGIPAADGRAPPNSIDNADSGAEALWSANLQEDRALPDIFGTSNVIFRADNAEGGSYAEQGAGAAAGNAAPVLAGFEFSSDGSAFGVGGPLGGSGDSTGNVSRANSDAAVGAMNADSGAEITADSDIPVKNVLPQNADGTAAAKLQEAARMPAGGDLARNDDYEVDRIGSSPVGNEDDATPGADIAGNGGCEPEGTGANARSAAPAGLAGIGLPNDENADRGVDILGAGSQAATNGRDMTASAVTADSGAEAPRGGPTVQEALKSIFRQRTERTRGGSRGNLLANANPSAVVGGDAASCDAAPAAPCDAAPAAPAGSATPGLAPAADLFPASPAADGADDDSRVSTECGECARKADPFPASPAADGADGDSRVSTESGECARKADPVGVQDDAPGVFRTPNADDITDAPGIDRQDVTPNVATGECQKCATNGNPDIADFLPKLDLEDRTPNVATPPVVPERPLIFRDATPNVSTGGCEKCAASGGPPGFMENTTPDIAEFLPKPDVQDIIPKVATPPVFQPNVAPGGCEKCAANDSPSGFTGSGIAEILPELDSQDPTPAVATPPRVQVDTPVPQDCTPNVSTGECSECAAKGSPSGSAGYANPGTAEFLPELDSQDPTPEVAINPTFPEGPSAFQGTTPDVAAGECPRCSMKDGESGFPETGSPDIAEFLPKLEAQDPTPVFQGTTPDVAGGECRRCSKKGDISTVPDIRSPDIAEFLPELESQDPAEFLPELESQDPAPKASTRPGFPEDTPRVVGKSNTDVVAETTPRVTTGACPSCTLSGRPTNVPQDVYPFGELTPKRESPAPIPGVATGKCNNCAHDHSGSQEGTPAVVTVPTADDMTDSDDVPAAFEGATPNSATGTCNRCAQKGGRTGFPESFSPGVAELTPFPEGGNPSVAERTPFSEDGNPDVTELIPFPGGGNPGVAELSPFPEGGNSVIPESIPAQTSEEPAPKVATGGCTGCAACNCPNCAAKANRAGSPGINPNVVGSPKADRVTDSDDAPVPVVPIPAPVAIGGSAGSQNGNPITVRTVPKVAEAVPGSCRAKDGRGQCAAKKTPGMP